MPAFVLVSSITQLTKTVPHAARLAAETARYSGQMEAHSAEHRLQEPPPPLRASRVPAQAASPRPEVFRRPPLIEAASGSAHHAGHHQ